MHKIPPLHSSLLRHCVRVHYISLTAHAFAGELGAAFVADLADLAEDDLVEVGMKKLEVKRLLRAATRAS